MSEPKKRRKYSGYIVFGMHWRKTHAKPKGVVEARAIMKKIGAAWSKLSDAKKKEWAEKGKRMKSVTVKRRKKRGTKKAPAKKKSSAKKKTAKKRVVRKKKSAAKKTAGKRRVASKKRSTKRKKPSVGDTKTVKRKDSKGVVRHVKLIYSPYKGKDGKMKTDWHVLKKKKSSAKKKSSGKRKSSAKKRSPAKKTAGKRRVASKKRSTKRKKPSVGDTKTVKIKDSKGVVRNVKMIYELHKGKGGKMKTGWHRLKKKKSSAKKKSAKK